MARMWPRTLPEWVLQDPRRAAEREVYRQLGQTLDDEWSAYYSRPWWGLNKTGGEIDGECDFIVVHPDRGILFLEVKGGLIGYDPLTSKWSSRDRLGIKYTIKDPLGQAVGSKHQLLKKFEKAPGWPSQRVRLRHGAVFPDSQPEGRGLIGGYEQELICFSKQLRDGFDTWIAERLNSRSEPDRDKEIAPGSGGLAAVETVVASPVRMRVPLHRQVESEVAQQDALLTGAQLQAIAFIDAFPRIVVEGGAGTGKTIVAGELAVRYASAGRTVLLCCLSEALAASLIRRIGPIPRLEVTTLRAMRIGCDGRKGRYEAVIVDEGQDVDWSDWDLIESSLSSGGLLRVFYDSNQAVYRARDDLEARLLARGISLVLNLRNTRRIAAVTELLYRGPLIRCEGSEGAMPLLVEAQAGKAHAVARVVRGLVVDESMAPADVAVLVPDDGAAAEVRELLIAAGFKVCSAQERSSGCVVVETIARFKGLEALAVVLLADRITGNNPELCYVGVSRARALLVVVGPVGGTLLGRAMIEGGAEKFGTPQPPQ